MEGRGPGTSVVRVVASPLEGSNANLFLCLLKEKAQLKVEPDLEPEVDREAEVMAKAKAKAMLQVQL